MPVEWSLAQLLSDATARVGRRGEIPQSVASRYVNQAYSDVADAVPHGQLETVAVTSTSSGSQRLDLPDDLDTPLSLSNLSSDRTLARMDQREFDAADQSSVGEPRQYVLFNEWMELQPSPDSAYSLQLRYRKQPPPLVNTADVPSVDTQWRFPILLKAEEYLHRWIGDSQGEAEARNRYLGTVRRLRSTAAKRQENTRTHVNVVYADPDR